MGIFSRSKARTAGAVIPSMPPDYDGQPVGGGDGSTLNTRQFQDRMHTYVHEEGLARFSTAFVADAASRVDLVGEAYVAGVGWVQDFETDDTKQLADEAKVVNALVSKLRGKYTDVEQTLWNIVWHKRSVGECYLVNEDDDQELGVTYTPYSYKAVESKLGGEGGKDRGYKISDRPGARIGQGARWVPESQVSRIWTPHPDFPLLPYSSLWAGLRDLDRYELLGRVIDRTANSALLQKGMVWFPGEAMDDVVDIGGGNVMPRLVRDYYAAANVTLKAKSASDVSAVAPFAIWYDSDFGEPQVIKFGMPMESSWFDMRSSVIADFARTVDLPSVMVINGGAGGSSGTAGSSSNHWSDLLIDRRTFDMTVGRDLDTVCHEDLTRSFLRPQITALGQGRQLTGRWRVGYDPTKLLVNQDRSLFALDGLRIGLISYKATAKRLGFRQDELAGPDDIKKLAELVTRSAQSDGSTRRRMRQDSTSMGGQGAETNLPHAASASSLFSMSGDQLRTLALRVDSSTEGILWLDA